ncbi:MAG: ABC transporter substrate-binding protein [Synergistaceae bacterium]|jgi:branched-chain amino acid transport system substrate-binding protein|nr:ABC transporter substrate-binding protein [Synergistaceae bacterium]
MWKIMTGKSMGRALAGAFIAAFCWGNAAFGATEDAIRVGVIAPLTGGVAMYGSLLRNGVEFCTKIFNAAGGVAGRRIELVIYDDKGDPTEALTAYNKLVTADEVAAFIGPVTSAPTFGVAEASAADNIPGITGTATHPDVTSYGKNYFRACFEDPFQGGTMARFAAEKLGAKTAAVIYNVSDAYSTGLYNAFSTSAAGVGLRVVAAESYTTDDVDFNAQLTRIAELAPDVLFLPDYYNRVYLLSSQARKAGITATFLGVDGADGILEIEGADVSVFEGLHFANHYFSDDPSPLVQDFRKNYEAEFGAIPNSLAALGYDAALILFDAIKKAAADGVTIGATPESYQAIIDKMAATDLDCVTGHISFRNNNPVKEVAITKIEGGAYSFAAKY